MQGANDGIGETRRLVLPLHIELQLTSCVASSESIKRDELLALVRRFPGSKSAIAEWLRAFLRRHDLPAGRQFGRYWCSQELGRGGMGVVNIAWDEDAERWVALKRLREDWTDEEARERFRREAKTLARLRHPSIVPVFETGNYDGCQFLAMELVRGIGLERLIRALQDAVSDPGHLTGHDIADVVRSTVGASTGAFRGTYMHEIAKIVADAAEAIAVAHEHGIVHRDIKPANIMVCSDGTIRVLDFGLARGETDRSLTRSSEVFGSPDYLAPEQLRGAGNADARTDIYALGVTLYELLGLRRPFVGHTIHEVFHRIQHGTPTPLSALNSKASRDLTAIADKAMARNPGDRYSTAMELRDDLRAYRDGIAVSAQSVGSVTRFVRRVRRHGTWIAVIGLVLITFASLVAHVLRLQGRLDARRLLDDIRALSTLPAERYDALESRVIDLPEPYCAEGLTLLREYALSRTLVDQLRKAVDGGSTAVAEWEGKLSNAKLAPGDVLQAQNLVRRMAERASPVEGK